MTRLWRSRPAGTRWLSAALIVGSFNANPVLGDPPRIQESDFIPANVPRPGVTLPGFRPEPGRSYATIFLPNPITDREMERWSRVLNLSEEQRAALDRMFETYESQDRGIRERAQGPILASSAELGGQGAIIIEDPAMAEKHAAMVRAVEALAKNVERCDSALIHVLAEILGESQLPLLPRVEYIRLRARSQAMPARWPASNVDLSFIVDQLRLHEHVLPANLEAFSAVLCQYEASAGRIAAQHVEAAYDANAESARLLAGMAHAVSATQHDEQRRRLRFVQTRKTFAERRLVNLNRTFLPLIADFVPDPFSTRFEQEALARCYPEVYPNPFDLAAIFDQASAGTADAAQVNDLIALLDMHVSQQRHICDQMVNTVEDWMEHIIDQNATDPKESNAFKAEMVRLHEARGSAAKQSAAMLEQILTPALRETLQPGLDTVFAAAARREPREMGYSFRP